VRTVGTVTTALAVVAAALAVVVAVRALPDVRRYLRIRAM
jgi:hypothetical protein